MTCFNFNIAILWLIWLLGMVTAIPAPGNGMGAPSGVTLSTWTGPALDHQDDFEVTTFNLLT